MRFSLCPLLHSSILFDANSNRPQNYGVPNFTEEKYQMRIFCSVIHAVLLLFPKLEIATLLVINIDDPF